MLPPVVPLLLGVPSLSLFLRMVSSTAGRVPAIRGVDGDDVMVSVPALVVALALVVAVAQVMQMMDVTAEASAF